MATTQNTYPGDGSTVSYSFTFPYLEETDIKVSLDGVVTTAYSLSNATTVTFDTAPGTGVAIRIYRDTNNDALAATFFAGSAIRAQDLNDDFLQNAYVTQEVKNRYLDRTTGGTVTGDITLTGDFTVTGDTDLTGALDVTGNVSIDGTLDMNANRILDVGTPTATTDATNKTYVDTQDALKVAKAGDTMTGNLAMSNNRVTGLGTPSATTDATNKAYVDAYILTVYQGPQASDPTTRSGGSALQEGDLYFNTVEDVLKAYTGTEWVVSASAGQIVRWRKTAAGGETSLSGNDDGGSSLSYVVGNEQVFLNGVLQQRGVDYTASTGTSITGLTALTAGDIVELHAVQGYTSGIVSDGSITSAKIANDTIVNEDVNSSAAIAATKLSFTQSGTGATARTIDSKLKDVVSVKDFGAVGDGTTDDRAAIQAALEAVAVNGGTLVFPKGTYVLTATATINGGTSHLGLTDKDNISIIGYGATLSSTVTASTVLFNFNGCRNINIEGLTIQGQHSRTGSTINDTSIGVFLLTSSARDSNDISIKNVRASDCYYFLQVVGSSPYTYRVRDFSVHNCLLNGGYYGLNLANNGDNFTATGFRTNACVRSYFPYGVDGHDVSYRSGAGDVFTDCLIKAYDRDTTNIRVKARISGNSSSDAKLTLESQHPPATQPSPATLSNIDIQFDDRDSTGSKSIRFAYFRDSTETATSSARLFHNIKISGWIRNDFDIAVTQSNGHLDISNLIGAATPEIWNEKGFYYLDAGLDSTNDPDKLIRGLVAYSQNTSAPNPPAASLNWAGLSFGSNYSTLQLAQADANLNLYARHKRGTSAWTSWAVFPDQESGSWTPVLQFGGGATGMTGTQTGRYVRMGNLVYVWCEVNLTNKGTSTGAAQITGLPFTVAGSQWTPLYMLFYSGGASLSAGLSGYANAGTSNLVLHQQGSTGVNTFSNANFTNTSRFWLSCIYRIETY